MRSGDLRGVPPTAPNGAVPTRRQRQNSRVESFGARRLRHPYFLYLYRPLLQRPHQLPHVAYSGDLGLRQLRTHQRHPLDLVHQHVRQGAPQHPPVAAVTPRLDRSAAQPDVACVLAADQPRQAGAEKDRQRGRGSSSRPRDGGHVTQRRGGRANPPDACGARRRQTDLRWRDQTGPAPNLFPWPAPRGPMSNSWLDVSRPVPATAWGLGGRDAGRDARSE